MNFNTPETSIFEISWEVCNKIGGIYTVLSTKANSLQNLYPDRIIFIGPDFGTNRNDFVEDKSILSGVSELKYKFDVKVRVGRWNIPGSPITLLVDFKGIYPSLNEIYSLMWEKFKVDSLHSYGDYDESCAFSIAASEVINKIVAESSNFRGNVIAHFNEWTTGMGLLYLKLFSPDIATVFTTHATSIGRSICGNNKPLYGYFEGYNGDQMAGELNMQSKHSLEKAAAHNADCFTTVSKITAKECGQLLEIFPHVITPNGFNKEISGTIEQQKSKRRTARRKIFQILKALTGKDYPSDTFLVATSGRNEYRNKGIDMFLDSMAKLRELDSDVPAVGLILVPAWVKEARQDLEENIQNKEKEILQLKNITHYLNNPEEDLIYKRIKELNFNNAANDAVDVVYVPCYLNGNDGILDIKYYDLLPGLDYTVFPSYYEPWGYTPLESIAFGVPTITTGLSGFGQWTSDRHGDNSIQNSGVAVFNRTDFNYQETVENIAGLLWSWIRDVKNRKKLYKPIQDCARKEAAEADWSNFITHYVDAYNIASQNRDVRNQKSK